MKTLISALALAIAAAAPVQASSNASKDDAVAMVKKGIAFIKANGVDKGYAAITQQGRPVHRPRPVPGGLRPGRQGACAHGANGKQVGKDLIDLTDVDGKYFVKERVAWSRPSPPALAGLQVHQPGEQEDRAQADVLREARRDRGLRRHLQVRPGRSRPTVPFNAPWSTRS
jgi:cytochrome c